MGDDRSALIENIYDLTMVTTHADSLVRRIEGHIGRRETLLPNHTGREISVLADRLTAIAAYLRHALHDNQCRVREPAE
jgi:hypothetical protein